MFGSVSISVYSSVPTPHLHTCVLQTQMVGKKTHLAVFPCSLCSTSPVRSAQALDRCGASFPTLSVILTPGSTEQTEKVDSGWHCTATSIAHHFCVEGLVAAVCAAFQESFKKPPPTNKIPDTRK